jgi:hypothetical protein
MSQLLRGWSPVCLVCGAGGWVLQQLPAWGLPIADPLTWQPAGGQWHSSSSKDQQEQQDENTSSSSSSTASWVDVQVGCNVTLCLKLSACH